MSITAQKKVKVGKTILIVLAVLCVCLSLLNCKQGEAVTEKDFAGNLVSTTYTENCFSVFACILAGIQILLVWKNYFRMQAIPGILSGLRVLLVPLVIDLQNMLDDIIVYVRAPSGESAARRWEVTPAGYTHIAVGLLLLAASVFAAWWLPRQKALATGNPDTEERNEGSR